MKHFTVVILTICALNAEAQQTANSPNAAAMVNYTTARDLSTSDTSIGKSCSILLKNGAIYDKTNYLSSRNRISQYTDWACSSDFQTSEQMSKSALELGIPVENLPEPLKFKFTNDNASFRESLKQWCASSYAHLADDSLRVQFSQIINQGVIAAVGKCIEAERDVVLKKYGAFISAIPQNQYLNSYGVSLTLRPPLPNYQNKITSIEPKEVSCEFAGKRLSPTPQQPFIVDANEINLTCYKDGATPAHIAINTHPASATPWLLLPGTRDDSEITEISQNQKAIFQMMRMANEANSVTFNALKNWGTAASMVQAHSRTGQHDCPPGYYVYGIAAVDTDGGKFCSDCISRVDIACRPLNVK